MKLALGTAQFGFNYGIANQSGQVSYEKAKAIITLAKSGDIDMLDTAIAYGESEALLGIVGINDFKVITKLPAIPDEVTDVFYWVSNQIESSLKRLNVKSLYGVLLHRSQQLTGIRGYELSQALKQLKVGGRVQKIGVSIYSPNELERVMPVCEIDIVQAPFSIEIHVRSVFLQGLLLMPKASIPEKFKYWMPIFDKWHDFLDENHISGTRACVTFVQNFTQISKVIVGVESALQLEELIKAAGRNKDIVLPNISCADENLINPSNWNAL